MLLVELGFPIKGPKNLYCDNKATISIAYDHVQHDRTKPVEIEWHFIKDHLKSRCICTPFIQTKYQLTDVSTKWLSGAQFSYLVNKLGILNIYSPA